MLRTLQYNVLHITLISKTGCSTRIDVSVLNALGHVGLDLSVFLVQTYQQKMAQMIPKVEITLKVKKTRTPLPMKMMNRMKLL